jgi:hypothetical protein
MSEYVSVPREPTVQMYIDGGRMLKICASEGNLYSKSAYRVYKSMLAAAPAEQRTAAQQGQGLVRPSGDSCSKPTTPVAAAATLTDEQIDDIWEEAILALRMESHAKADAAFSQAKRANELAAEVERLRGDVQSQQWEWKERAESAERRLAVVVSAANALISECNKDESDWSPNIGDKIDDLESAVKEFK